MSGQLKTKAKEKPVNILHRSRMEIGRVLQSLQSEEIAVFADIGSLNEEQIFVSHILSFDVDADQMLLAYGPDKAINNAVLKYPALRLKANHQGARLAFMAYQPANAIFKGHPVIQVQLPRALLLYHREHARIRVPRDAALRCLIRFNDEAPVEMSVVDISLDGMGCLQHQGLSQVPVGSVLRDCTVTLPKGNSILVDLMVRYTKPVFLKDGTLVNRIGVRFVQRPDEIEALIRHFTRYLDDSEL